MFFFTPFRVESLFPKTPWISQKYAMLAFKAKQSGGEGRVGGGLVFLVKDPQAGESHVKLRSPLPWGELLQL